MTQHRPFVIMAFGVLLAAFATWESRAAEKWADPGMPVMDGLELWLDAGKVNAARAAAGQASLKSGDVLDAWPDGSGKTRHVLQPQAAARPKLVQVGDAWIVRFDGSDEHFRRTGVNRQLEALTVFLVAAPHANPGEFRGFLAGNAPDRRDYESGFTIDMGPGLSFELDNVNVEGRGFGGAQNLLKGFAPFGTLQVLEATVSAAEKKVRLAVNGKPAGERPFTPGPVHVDELTVGARFYTNGGGPQQVRGFLQGDIAEVLVFSRVLTPDETKQVREYLTRKHAKLKETLPGTLKLPGTVADRGEPLVSVTPPPPVQMLLPGFTVRALPVDLTNINSIKYRADGKLVALAYNGNIFLLSDTDGDGLEDKAELFWDNQLGGGKLRGPIGLALTPPGYKHGNGAFVPSKGRVSLIVDTDGDDKADEEIIVAEGWKEIPQNVDAVGIALDKEGNIYFAIGAADYSNGYLLDKEGKAHFDLKSDRGTVQKVSPDYRRVVPDFKKREAICTGVRFPVAMAFNPLGDLFCSDQEGATWMPNGNPLDELLHIQPGRHYGFPPRHPRHLPGVIDEPSVFDYGPQHQSTCGLNFNVPVELAKRSGTDLKSVPQAIFGPASWRDDAIVCGESRGKLYRTKLVKTAAGYIAQTQLFACLNMLTVDACVSPHGDLVVACHSGPPDWGTGPQGKGKLYKITYKDREHPQPTAIWAASPQEVHVAFDKPLDPQHLKNLAAQTKITYGQYVRAGDRFESLFPPYAIVQMQRKTPRFNLPVLGSQVTSDRRTLILSTAPMREAVHYAVMLPGMGRPALESKGMELPQHPQVDLDYTLTGVQATWQPKDGGTPWFGWLPHLDLDVTRILTEGSVAHEALWEMMKQPGTLSLQTKLRLRNMLRPAVQPGSRLDHEWPPEKVVLTVQSNGLLSGEAGDTQTRIVGNLRAFDLSSDLHKPITLKLQVKTEGRRPELKASWHTAEDPRPRPLPLHRLLLPFADLEAAPQIAVRERAAELDGGSWARGRQVFLSEQAACAKCHRLHGQGSEIGPDLGNLVHRDYASVLRDIAQPSFGINPDYVTFKAELKDGRALTGTVRSQGNQILIGDEKGQTTTVSRDDIERLEPSHKSTMPDDVPKTLGPEKLKDLLTFLLTDPPRMPQNAKLPPPRLRTRAEVQAVLAGTPNPPEKTRPLHVVLVAGPKDHGLGEHDYPAWQKVWTELLAAADGTKVTTAWEWPKAEQLKMADVLVFFQRGSWTKDRAEAIDAYLARGGGLVYIHWAVEGGSDAPGFAQRIGLASASDKIRYRHGPVDLGFETGAKHPIGRNFSKVHLHDESYWKLLGDPKSINLLATSVEDGQPTPQFWTLEPSKGRVFVSIPGHYSWTFDDPLFRILLLRGIAWTAREPVDRFNELVWPGARVE